MEIIGISISTDTYNYGIIPLSSSVVSTGTIVTTNTGNVTETYEVQGSSAISAGKPPWTLSTSTGADKFCLYAIFNSIVPQKTDFLDADDQLKYTNESGSDTQFAINSSTYTGAGIPKSETRNVWFFLKMPSTTSTSAEKTITVTITAGESP